MREARWDEYQLQKRRQYGSQALYITFALILINGIIKTTYIWAKPMTEAVLLIVIPGVYVGVRAIWNHAYISKKDPYPGFTMFMLGAVAVLNFVIVGLSIYWGVFEIVEDGKLNEQAGILAGPSMIGVLAIVWLIRRAVDRRADAGE